MQGARQLTCGHPAFGHADSSVLRQPKAPPRMRGRRMKMLRLDPREPRKTTVGLSVVRPLQRPLLPLYARMSLCPDLHSHSRVRS